MCRFILLVFSLLISRELVAENSLLMAKSPGALGEPGHDYLFSDSVFVQAFYNDVLGQTDKLLTNGSRLGLIYGLGEYSLELSGSWRFVTPAIKDHNFSEYNLENPPGVFADWMSVNAAFARSFELSKENFLVLQLSGGYDHFGDKAAKGVQQDVHRSLEIDYEIYNYDDQIETESYSLGVELGFVHFLTENIQFKSALGYSSNPLITSGYFEQYVLYNQSESLKFSGSYKLLHQLGSDAGIDLRTNREEFTLGLLLFDIYKPSVKYISNYVKNDSTRQIITDFLSFQIQF